MPFTIDPTLIENDDVEITTDADGALSIVHKPSGQPIGLDQDGTLQTPAVNTDEAFVSGRFNNTIYVTSASEMNAALDEIAGEGGRVRWKPGEYTGEDFTEQVVFPADTEEYVIDMRNVHIHIRDYDPYHGEDGSFFLNPDGGSGSTPLHILGPHEFQAVSATTQDVNPHVFELWNTRRCFIRPHINGNGCDRGLYFRQSNNSGHHVNTEHTFIWGCNVGIQIGDAADPLGKDRCRFYGQISGYGEAGVYLEQGLNNRIYAQVERPSDSADEHVSGHRIVSGQNSLMLTHRSSTGHATDIRAPNCGIDDSGAIGAAGKTFENERLAVRPTNIAIPNYERTAFDFSTDWRPMLDVIEQDTSTVGYDGTRGELTLQGQDVDNRAIVQSTGPAGLMSHFFHAYANVHIGATDGSLDNKAFLFGAWVDANNYAYLKYDAAGSSTNESRPLGVEIVAGGTVLKDEFFDIRPSTRPEGWIVYLNDEYQVFFNDYDIVDETSFDLSTWPGDPKFRAEEWIRGTSGEPVHVRSIEHGVMQKYEAQGF